MPGLALSVSRGNARRMTIHGERSNHNRLPREQVRVCVWVGEDAIVNWRGEPALAARWESKMRRRFPGWHVTSESVSATSNASTQAQEGM